LEQFQELGHFTRSTEERSSRQREVGASQTVKRWKRIVADLEQAEAADVLQLMLAEVEQFGTGDERLS
jgi:hypothetical protein